MVRESPRLDKTKTALRTAPEDGFFVVGIDRVTVCRWLDRAEQEQ